MSAALSFAQDAEYELVLMPNCGWQFCDLKSSSVCRDCGLRVHRREPMGKFLLERTREQVQDEAERREREAAREAERRDRERKRARIEARREAERLEREKAEQAEQAESAARWEASMGELNASGERLLAALRERMDQDKKQEKQKQGKPPSEARCVTM
jgi:hypothetical protein